MPASRQFWAMPLAPLRYAAVWAVYGFMRLLVLLPWRWQISVCSAGGSLARQLAGNRRRVVATNLRLCLPHLDDAERDRIERAHFRALGASICEMAMGWFGPVERVRDLVTIEGLDHVHRALERGNGVVLYSGHFTSFEIFFPALRPHLRHISGMYKAQRNPVMNEIMTRGRLRNVDVLYSKEEVRGMLKELKRNSVFWYAADQSYASKGAALIPFFGEPAMTNTAISRIASISGATVIPFLPRRLPGNEGYRLTLGPPLENFPTDDPVIDTTRLVETIEALASQCIEQYWWIHKRFKGRPAPLPDVYARRSQPSEAEH